MEQNMDRHIYLYAKNHYKRTDVILDLKKIHGLMYGFDATEVGTEAVIRNLIRLTFPHLKDDVSEFLNAPCREQNESAFRIYKPILLWFEERKLYKECMKYAIDNILDGIERTLYINHIIDLEEKS